LSPVSATAVCIVKLIPPRTPGTAACPPYCERGMRKVMKRATKEREEGMKEESKGNQLTMSYCSAFLLSIIKISKRIISKERGRNTD
jgi:hypothetical protein